MRRFTLGECIEGGLLEVLELVEAAYSRQGGPVVASRFVIVALDHMVSALGEMNRLHFNGAG